MSDEQNRLAELTAQTIGAYVSNNSVSASDLPQLIKNVAAAFMFEQIDTEAAAPKQEPAVSIRASVKQDYLVCLEDGKKMTMLKRYLMTRYGMTPDQYRAKWGLPANYPMVAPNYRDRRSQLAKSMGLGAKGRGNAPVAPQAVEGSSDANTEGAPDKAAAKPARRPRKPRASEAQSRESAPSSDASGSGV